MKTSKKGAVFFDSAQKHRVSDKWVIAIVILFMLNLVSASFLKGNSSSIAESYAPGSNLRGWINISLQNEPADKIIKIGNTNAGIKLIDLVNLNNVPKTCTPAGCEVSYSSANGEVGKNFSLNYDEEKLISFYLTGADVNITSLTFNLSVGNSPSCLSPLAIDIFNDDKIDWKSKNTGEGFSCMYGNGMGCFNPAETLSEVLIGVKPFCENITLMEGSKFILGAWVKRGSTPWTSGLLKMSLYNYSGKITECALIDTPSAIGGEINCTIDYLNNQIQNYYVCISSNSEIDDYRIKTESSNPCGFYAIPGQQTTYNDYYIYAKGAKFTNMGKLIFNQQAYYSYNQGNLAAELSDYLSQEYSRNCTLGCSIPMKFKSYGDINVSISGADLKYKNSVGQQPGQNKIYDASKTSSLVSSGFIILNLDNANLSIPNVYGNSTIELFLGNEKILSKEITVTGIPVIESIWPTIISAGTPIKFTAVVTSPGNKSIINYAWDFGDGTNQETGVNSVTHRYSSVGNYTIELKVKDAAGYEASKSVAIFAGSPKEILNITLKIYRERINNLTAQIAGYPAWIQDSLKKQLNLDVLDSSLSEFERIFSLDNTEERYIAMMSNLSEAMVPAFIIRGQESNYPIFLTDNANFDYLGEMGAGNAENASEAYKDGLLKWYSSTGIETNANYFLVYAQYDNKIEGILSYFKLKIKPLEEEEIDNYLIIGERAKVNSAGATEFSDATGITFSSLEERDLEFIILGNINPLKLNVYMSPKFDKLDLSTIIIKCRVNGICEKDSGETWRNCREDCKPVGWIIFYIIALIFAAFIAYIVIQGWYNKKYEGHLFKNKNDLFNLINFIDNALTKGLNEKEIKKNLAAAGWNSEQMNYAFKKIRGERIMPLEINLPKFEIKKSKRF